MSYLEWEPFEGFDGEIGVFEEGIDEISNGFGIEDLDGEVVLDDEGCVEREVLEKVAYFLTIWY
jgi:hypothetical protein